MDDRNLSFGVMLSGVLDGTDQPAAEVVRELAAAIEESAFDAVFVGDHVSIPRCGFDTEVERALSATPTDPLYDAFVQLSVIAGVTSELNVGTNICVAPYRRPLVLCRQVISLSALSNERLELGVGVGWVEEEFEALGVPFQQRGHLTDDFLEIVTEALTTGTVDQRTDQGETLEVDMAPSDEIEHLPIWIGGRSDAAFRRLADYGDGWTTIGDTPAQVSEFRERICDYWEAAGRDDELDIMLTRRIQVDDSEEATEPLAGPPEKIVADIESYRRSGVSQLVIDLDCTRMELATRLEEIERVGRLVETVK